MPIIGTAPNKTYQRTDGVYSGAAVCQQSDAAGNTNTDVLADARENDIAVGINAMLMKDGGNTPVADLPMGSFKHTGVAAGSATGHYTEYDQVVALIAACLADAQTYSDGLYMHMSGDLKAYAGATVPAWASGYWLMCDGSAVSRTTYADLFDAIGETWGAGDGSTTFNLPDLRGRIPVGLDDMGGSAANRVTAAGSGIDGDTLGASGGDETHTLSTSEIPAHDHGVNDSGHDHGLDRNLSSVATTGTGSYSDFVRIQNAVGSTGSAVTGITIQNSGGGAAHNNMQPSAMVNYLIKT